MGLKEYLATVDALSSYGGGIGELKLPNGNKKLFEALRTLPGEEVRILVGRRKKRGRHLAKLLELTKESKIRQKARCEHFSECGGCLWQHLPYIEQLKIKQKSIEVSFPSIKSLPIIPSVCIWHYRNKMEYTFSQDAAKNRYLGLCIPNGRSRVLNIKKCYTSPPNFLEVLENVRIFSEKENLEAFDQAQNKGMLKGLVLRQSPHTGELLVMLITSNQEFTKELQMRFIRSLLQLRKVPATIVHLAKNSTRGAATQFSYHTLYGSGFYHEKLFITDTCFLDLKVSASSFMQPNTLQAEILYRKALDLLGPLKGKLVFDLYSGCGIFGMLAASTAEKVVCIESHPQSIKDAKSNIQRNKIQNIEVIEGAVEEKLPELIQKMGCADFVIVDPPRMGLGAKTVNLLAKSALNTILYISCNLKTQAADFKEFERYDYQISACQPIDQFPHTPHLENILLLTKKGSS